MRTPFLCLIFCLFTAWLPAQQAADLLLSGPMVGYCQMREVMIWVQTNGPAQVQIAYTLGPGNIVYKTPPFQTSVAEAYTARILADQVQPGETYTYEVFINGQKAERPYPTTFQTPPLWQYRTEPPEMKIALGSCSKINDDSYDRPGNPYGGEYQIFQSIQRQQPDMMLWLGDNNYLTPADWTTQTGIIHRYTHSRHVEEMQPLLASTANYAIWDDHDYGPNDSDHTFQNKLMTLRAFKLFWGNPSYGLPGQGGITSSFEWGDAEFIMLDNRYFRSPNRKKRGTRTILGEDQLEWFLDKLVSSKATFKFVCIGGQVLNTADKFENYAAIAPEERETIIQAIAEEGVKNVIFLTGDRHHSEYSSMEKFGVNIIDFTVSPLTSGSHDASDEPNAHRVKGSHVGERNFGTIEITGTRKERKASFQLFDADGKPLWKKEVEAQY